MVLENTLTPGNAEGRRTKSFVRHLPTLGRILMGFLFFVFGTFGLVMALHLVPEPSQPMPEGARAFSDALTKTGYMLLLSSGTEFVVGVMLLCNRFVPLALTLIAPIIVNIFLFHAVLAPSGLGMAMVLAALEIALAWRTETRFAPCLPHGSFRRTDSPLSAVFLPPGPHEWGPGGQNQTRQENVSWKPSWKS